MEQIKLKQAAKKKQEQKERKRLKERARKAKIKSDPVLYERLKEKDRQLYLKRKMEGKIVKLSERPRREQKVLKAKSRESSKKHYHKKKQKTLLENAINIPPNEEAEPISDPLKSPSQTPTNDLRRDSPDPVVTSPAFVAIDQFQNVANYEGEPSTSKAPVVTSPAFVAIDQFQNVANHEGEPSTSKAQEPLLPSSHVAAADYSSLSSPSLSDSSHSYKLRLRGLEPQSDSSDVQGSITSTPKRRPPSKSLAFRKYKYRVNQEMKLLHKRIAELTATAKSYKKAMIRLKMSSIELAAESSREESDSSTEDLERPARSAENMQVTAIRTEVQTAVQKFYEDDQNSSMCPGKKDFITKKKTKKQKRYLSDSLLNLHKKFQRDHPEYKVSNSFFCKLRPFWVLVPKVTARDTCLCQIHENFNLIAMTLKRNNIILEKSPSEILAALCCDATNVDCLKRKCGKCTNRHLHYNEFDNNKEIKYSAWSREKKNYTKNGEVKTSLKTVKKQSMMSPKELLKVLEKKLEPYMNHVANMIAQSRYFKKLKAEQNEEECIIHCDFSENYAAKYANEVQSFHFGSSRQQITLHTSIIYLKKNNSTVTQSFCTVSECLRHDAVAVWEHLQPIFSYLEIEAPQIRFLYIMSDSPSAQYRNRKMFFITSCIHWNLPNLVSVEWNYSESGHGKGAPDGVGGCLKSTADKIVARGNDIPDMRTLVESLRKTVKNVIIEVVEEANMLEKDMLMPVHLPEFKGTLSVHQVIWNSNKRQCLAMRKLSCAEEECFHKSSKCVHGQHIGFFNMNTSQIPPKKQKRGRKKDVKKPTNVRIESKLSLSDIQLSDSDSFFVNVPISDIMTPSLGTTEFSEIHNTIQECDADDSLDIFD